MKKIIFKTLFFSLFLVFAGCATEDRLTVDYEKYKLDNGLEVVLHVDKSDPVVSTAIMYHVGSSREVPGKTGFAHLFEHMLFQESENVPQDKFFEKIQNAGGTLNGFTSNDVTTYFEVVPKNALELVLWMESDRMGYFINTVTPAAFVNQQNVVQNEKRQRVDNQPYGHTGYVIDKNIFPQNHPYHWQVIGEMEDLQNATVQDVKQFYQNYYGPNNATLVVAGDFNRDSVKMLIDKYFAEIRPHGDVKNREAMPASIEDTIRLFYEDNFATVPEMNMVWPGPEQYSKDAYAMDFLARILSEGKTSPLYKVLVKEKRLTSEAYAWNYTLELAGEFIIQARANEGHSIDEMEKAVSDAFKRFEEEGITDKDIEKVKAGLERNFYNGISSVFDKSLQLAFYNTYKDDPGFIEEDVENIKAVTKEDVKRVYEKYIKGKPYVITSFVPKGETGLVASGSKPAEVVEENIENAVQAELNEPNGPAADSVVKTPSEIDRSVEPVTAQDPQLKIPEIWTSGLDNGVKVLGIEQNELPLVNIEVVIKGGFYLDDTAKLGVANLLTDAMMEGTKNKTPEELEEEIKLLGADINMYTTNEEIVLTANTLSRNFDQTMKLIEEILLEPRWDEEQFELAKIRTVNQLKQDEANPGYIARVTMKKLLYGDDHIFSHDLRGNASDVEKINIDDLKQFYAANFSPNLTTYHIAGNITEQDVMNSLQSLGNRWEPKQVEFPVYSVPERPDKAKLYFVDMPGSKQSVINIGYLALSRTNPDFYPAYVMNYKLGGSFSGVLNLILREEKGFTYGARSGFNELKEVAPFMATADVRSNATRESVEIFKDEMQKYKQGISENDLEFTKNALMRSNARRFETLNALTSMLRTISKYNLPFDYVKQEENIVENMSADEFKRLAEKYIIPDQMIYLVVGDAKTQMDQLNGLGLGKPELIGYQN